MMRQAVGNKAEHFSIAEFFSHMTCNFCQSDLELLEYSEIHASCMKYDGMPLKELMSIYTVLRVSALNGRTVGI